MSSAEPRVPHPRISDDPATYLRAATAVSTGHATGRTTRRDLRAAQRHDRAVQRAGQRRESADHRAGTEVERRLRDRTLGYPRPETVTARHERLSAVLTEEIAAGATVHRRLPRAARLLPPVIALMDGVVLFSFCADVFNVDSAHPVGVPALAAVMLALLGSGVAYVWLGITGLRIRSYRSGLGEVAWAAMRSLTRILLAIALILTVALAVLMYVRVTAEVADSGLATSTAVVVGTVFALLSAVANLAVVAVHALDGSDLAAELRHTGRLLSRRERRVSRLLRKTQQRAQCEDRIALRGRQHAERVAIAAATVVPGVPVRITDPSGGVEDPSGCDPTGPQR
jgi:hypothetical protein